MGRNALRSTAVLLVLGLASLTGCTATTGSAGAQSTGGSTIPGPTASGPGEVTPGAPATPTSPSPTPPSDPPSPSTAAEGSVRVLATLASGIDVPWGLAALPQGAVLLTERDSSQVSRLDVGAGRLTRLGLVPGVVSNVDQQGEAGLLGIAVSPTFARDKLVFVYYSTASDNRIARMTYDASRPPGRQLGSPSVIVKGIPHNVHHNGGRLAFGPDGYLYATTGDAQQPSLAQDKGSLGGKILRMTTTGRPAPGNPFGTLVWSYGHRNVQGIAWDADGRMWASEFGDHSEDELNLIERGHNYGWPQTEGETSRSGVTGPVAQWGPSEDSPSGVAVAGGSVWMAALRGERLWRVPLDGARVRTEPEDFLVGRYGRLRSVLAIDDGTLLLTTSNRDGRQAPGARDDRILLVALR